jgi:transposase
MLQITPQMKILVAVEPADFRKGIDGLVRLCKDSLQQDPFAGTVFVFRNRRGTAIKVLVYDGQGFWLCHKRLSEGRFRWWPSAPNQDTPNQAAKAKALAAHQLSVLFRSDPEEPIIKPAGNGTYRVDGALPIRAWNEVLGGNLPIDRFETRGGYVLDLSGRLPREGDQLADDRFHYRVLRMRGRRVRKVEVQEREREAVKP